MKLLLPVGSLILLLFFTISCKKDSGSKSALDGNWTFTSTTQTTSSTVLLDYGGGDIEKQMTTSTLSSTNNKGTISIGGGILTAKGVSYTLSGTMDYVDYINNIPQDPISSPISIPIPTFNSAATFKLIGSDSIYYPNGGFSSLGGGAQSNAAGGRYTLAGNTLTMVMKVDTSFSTTSQGIPVQKHDVATQTVVLTRQ